ncbi:MAG: hypothetical protein ACP5D2_03695 [Candidatus Nanoarchaeia archaeon]
MIIKTLKLENIRSYKQLEITFPEGATLLSGDIGAGKTSILLALQFALFGLQPGQKGASLIRQGEDNAKVILEVDIDGNQIILERHLKKSSKSITQNYNAITINQEQKELSTSEMKNKVITLLKYPKEFLKKSNLLYKFTVYTPQEEMKAIIQERPEIRLDTLRHIFGVDRYKRIKENLQIFLQKIKENIKMKEAEIQELNVLREKLQNQKEYKIKLSREINNLQLEYNKLVKEKQEKEQSLQEIRKTIEEKRKLDSELSNLQASIQGKQDLANRLGKEIMNMQKQVKEKINFSQEKLTQANNLLEKHKEKLEQYHQSYMELNSKISVLESKKEQALTLKDKVSNLDNCPTCYQRVSQEHKDKIAKKSQYDIDDADRELVSKIETRNQLIKDIEATKQLINNYEKDKYQLEQNKIKFQHQRDIETKIKSDSIVLDRTNNEIASLKEKQEQISNKLKGYEETENISIKKEQEFNQIQEQARNKEISLAEKNKELELLKKQLQELEGDISKKEQARQELNYLRGLQDWLNDRFLYVITVTENNVMAKLRNEFSRIFSEWFAILVSDSLKVRLDEDFTPIIENQDYEIDYEFLSGGERTAVALAYRLALNQVLNSLLSRIKTKDLVILDEPTDGFSEEQLDKMRDIFQELDAEQTILVSHEPKIESFVDNVIRIKKEGTSQIEKISQ